MTDKFKILAEFAKDISFETPDVETFFKTKENISKYNLNIDINSKPLKNKLVEINIILKFFDANLDNKRSNIEVTYTVVVRIEDKVTEKKELEKIIVCEIPNLVYPKIENLFKSIIEKSGLPKINIEKRVDFEKLYNEKMKIQY